MEDGASLLGLDTSEGPTVGKLELWEKKTREGGECFAKNM